jgi:3-hydroxyisobutyrate dehydrogenase
MIFMRKYGTKNLGFVGLGKMGALMSHRLLKKYENVIIFDKNSELRSHHEFKSQFALSLKDFRNCDYIFTMLPDAKSTEHVLFSNDGILNSLKRGATIINSGTIGISASCKIFDRIGKDFEFIDAPVSGGTIGAEKGTLTFMVSGNENSCNQIKPLLETMGKNIIFLGRVGQGQAAKICNNMLLAINMVGASEAYVLAKKLGLDLKTFNNLINSSSGRSWVTEINNPVPDVNESCPSSKKYSGGFSSQLLLKDIILALDASRENSMNLLAIKAAHEYFSKMIEKDKSSETKDMSYLFQYILSKSNNKP